MPEHLYLGWWNGFSFSIVINIIQIHNNVCGTDIILRNIVNPTEHGYGVE